MDTILFLAIGLVWFVVVPYWVARQSFNASRSNRLLILVAMWFVTTFIGALIYGGVVLMLRDRAKTPQPSADFVIRY